jgi:O-antigen/teichoic acid export membrane protein
VDIWVIGIFCRQVDVAIYGAASRLALLISVPMLIANAVVAPLIAEYYAKGEKTRIELTLRTIATITAIPSLFFLIIYALFGNILLELAFGEIFSHGLICLIVLSCGQFIYICLGTPGLVLMMTGYQREIMLICFLSLIVTIIGSIIAAKYYGINGVAFATAAGLTGQACLQMFVVKYKLNISTQITFANILNRKVYT